jgi:hypothetical protein
LPEIKKDVIQYVGKCDACHNKSGNREFIAHLGEVEEPSNVFQIANCDIVGVFTSPAAGNESTDLHR